MAFELLDGSEVLPAYRAAANDKLVLFVHEWLIGGASVFSFGRRVIVDIFHGMRSSQGGYVPTTGQHPRVFARN
jgi:hypothetical protein